MTDYEKYNRINKTELIEQCQCLENNYNVMKERFERVSDIANEEANKIADLRTLLRECKGRVLLCMEMTSIGYEDDEKLLKRINVALGESEE